MTKKENPFLKFRSKKVLLAITFLCGIVGLFSQVIIFRELMSIFKSNELIMGLILASWLVLGAIGSLFLSKVIRFSFNFIILMAVIPLSLLFVNIFSIAFRPLGGATWNLWKIVSVALLGAGTINLFLGSLFAHFAKIAKNINLKLYKVYIADAIGDAVGGVLSLLIIGNIHNLPALALLSFALSVTWISVHLKLGRIKWFSIALSAVFLFLVLLGGGLEKILDEKFWDEGKIKSIETRYGKAQVVSKNGPQYVYENNRLIASPGDTLIGEIFTHTALLHHSNPENLMLVGGAYSGIPKYALTHNVNEINYVELNRRMVDFTSKYLPIMKILEDEKIDVHYTDPVLWIKSKAKEGTYDGIIISAPNPNSGRLNRYFTVRSFKAFKRSLQPKGIFSFSLKVGQNYMTPEGKNLVGSVYNSLTEVFKNVMLYRIKGRLIFVAAKGRELSSLLPQEIKEKLKARNIESQYLVGRNINYLFQKFKQEQTEEIVEASSEHIFKNTDFQPIAYFLEVLRWGKLGGLGSGLNIFLGLKLWMWIVICALIGIFIKIINIVSDRKIGRVFLIPIFGFQGLMIELILLYYYQALSGYLYWAVGLISSVVMVGIFLGSFLYEKFLNFKFRSYFFLNLSFSLLLLGNLNLLDTFLSEDIFLITFNIIFLQAVSGILIGMYFPLATEWMKKKSLFTNNVGGSYFGLELLGSAVAAISGALILIPILGMKEVLYGWIILLTIISLSSKE